jgi:hypothetical protein
MRAFVGESRWGTCGRRGAVVPGCAAEPATPGFVVKRLRRTEFSSVTLRCTINE